jgi:tetratricopeptide (TPR) repeat protein
MRTSIIFALAIAYAATPTRALAQGANAAAAEAMFQEGRALFQEGKYAEACPKLAESHRMDPATGTLLALALCHEGEGKLASAWSEYKDAESKARTEGRDDRRDLARERSQALEPRLSKLAIDVPPEVAATPGLEIKRDSAVIGPAAFGVLTPIDGGDHRIEVSAPGKKPWSTVRKVQNESDQARVAVPPLEDAPQTAAAPPTAAASTASERSDSGGWPPLRTAALVTAGAGVVAMGIGGYLAMDAKSSYDDAIDDCTGGACPPGPYDEIQSARTQGTVATVLFVAGGAALGTGVVLWFVAPRGGGERRAAKGPRVERVVFGPGAVHAEGTF